MKQIGRLRTIHLALCSVLLCAGCGTASGRPQAVWGRRGLQPGDLIRPRVVAIDNRAGQDLVYVVDFTGRIQVYTGEGEYLRGWSSPTIVNGRPAGIAIGRDGNVLVADSHYSQVLVYSPTGELLRKIVGTPGEGPGPFAYASDVVQDVEGNFYLSEFGENDRIRKLSPEGRYLKHWGNHGSRPGELTQPRGIALGDQCLYVADGGNHRIQVFDLEGNLLRVFGTHGSAPGELSYPYDVALGKDGDVYVVEFGNHRVQRFSPAGEPRGVWGGPGREPGFLKNPWGLAVDRRGRVYVADTDNHRVQVLFKQAFRSVLEN
jgi:DNA-binding beta-propeller fold protein YncE